MYIYIYIYRYICSPVPHAGGDDVALEERARREAREEVQHHPRGVHLEEVFEHILGFEPGEGS